MATEQTQPSKNSITKSRFDDHFSRKFFHMLSGTVLVYFYLEIFSRKQSVTYILVGTFLAVFFELLRVSWPRLNRLILSIFGPLMRENEAESPSALLFYILGLLWAFLVLPKILAVQAVLTLAWMDPIAGICGVRFGRKTWNRVFSGFVPEERRIPAALGAKTVEGSFAGFLASVFAGLVAWTGPWAQVLGPDGIWAAPDLKTVALFSLVGALIATIAEAWPSQWDDNAKIPFWTGTILFIMALLMGVPVGF